jgi:hypothetical protein
MNNTLNLPSNQKSMGLYYSGFISILTPSAWIEDTDKNVIKDIFAKSGPAVHELTHYFVDRATDGNYPIWFTEGTALFFENKITGFEWGENKVYDMPRYTISQLEDNFENLNTDYAYRSSFEIIREYVNNNSIDDLLNIMKKLGEGYSIEDFEN